MPEYDRTLQDLKEEIKARTDIVELISSYTRLKKSGKNWSGLCPFHADKNPSFSVSPDIGFYRCWSCGEKGDVITFVQKKQNLDFMEAMKLLAQRAGISFELKPGDREKASERQQMLALNKLAAQFFLDRLSKSPEAKDYLAKRGILKETQDKFQLGYAPPDWEALTFFLQRKQADMELAAKIGLIKARETEGSGYYDFYRHRIIFPIHNEHGDIIGFGGRAQGDDRAKYLNSQDSLVFPKSKTLYGYYFAKKKLAEGNTSPVFVEGYFDVITTHQAGFTQCIANMGTSMTEEQVKLLRNFSRQVILCYDSDAAGTKANLRSADLWESLAGEGAEVRIARLPAGDDPDSLLLRGETAAFQNALDRAITRVSFEIELICKRHDLHTDAGRGEALEEIIPVLATVSSKLARNRYMMDVVKYHPLYTRMGINDIIARIDADVEQYAATHKSGPSPRDRGYPLTEQTNRAPLAEQPAAPAYRPANKQQWGEWPMTHQVIRRNTEGGEKRNWQDYGGKRRKTGPASDSTPPSLAAPTLTGVEKAERQLLRACFSVQWRAFILARLHPDYLVTPLGRRLFVWIARTPAREDGSIDPMVLLRAAEEEENEGDPFATSEENPDPLGAQAEAFSESSGGIPPAVPQYIAKLSYFIREVLEDSPFLVSNESLNEAVVDACIVRLQKHRKDQLQRELAEVLRRAEEMAPEQRRIYIEQYHQKVRETRGSPPVENQ